MFLEDRPRTVFFAIFHQFVMKLLSFSKLVIVVYRITTSKGALHGQGPKNLQECREERSKLSMSNVPGDRGGRMGVKG